MSQDCAPRRHFIWDWLDDIEPGPDSQSSGGRPRKRPRLEGDKQILSGAQTIRLQTPPESGSGSVGPFSRMSNMPPARPTNQTDDTQDTRAEGDRQVSGGLVELTPRPGLRRKASAIDAGPPVSWLPSASSRSSSMASSKASKITRNSSPTKQLRNAELEETGFLRADLRNDTKPRSLDALTTELEKIVGGFGILPRNLQNEV